ncbi:protein S-acyltransferase 11 [Argentina anserina]|uniref:protein S-acyltransferase 11 n=1 Tax=Argentina anserina TaxID=57926 RepID=UPI00217658E5|nr:protein S-acyltransferase 11 [Potentilla anserina]
MRLISRPAPEALPIMAELPQEHITSVKEEYDVQCWGCGLHLLLPSNSPLFKCGWCGALTNQNARKRDTKYIWLRRWRDRIFVFILLMFMLFVICGGVWAMHPVLFATSYFTGIFHSILTFILSVATVYTFSSAAFKCAGTPPFIVWGSYPAVGKGGLENYTFCNLCSKPKSPRTHHCRTCGKCILDMDHHCPFIGNCVGADNHPHFIALLISVIVSTTYVSIMAIYVSFQIWPSVTLESINDLNVYRTEFALRYVRELILGLLRSAVFLDPRGLVLVYLFISSVSLGIGLFILLWQQLCYIYEGKTFLSDLTSQGNDEVGEKDCQNILRFFGWPYSFSRYMPLWSISRFLPTFQKKRHAK